MGRCGIVDPPRGTRFVALLLQRLPGLGLPRSVSRIRIITIRQPTFERACSTRSQFHLEQMAHERGFLFHFADIVTGKRIWDCEMSSIDTAIFLCGALTCRAYFSGDSGPERQIRDLATKLYERVDWPWMLNGGSTFSMGYKPESGFLKARWSTYCELMMLYLLAIGSPTHPVEPTYWQNFARPYINYAGFRYLSDLAPLFTHQYSHAWFDFRNQRDRYVNYFENSVAATRAHKAFCLAQPNLYTDDYWGSYGLRLDRGGIRRGVGRLCLGRIDGVGGAFGGGGVFAIFAAGVFADLDGHAGEI